MYKKMTETEEEEERRKQQRYVRKRRWCIVTTVVLFLLLILFIICIILAFTVFKPKDPQTKIVSATVDGISPRVSLPVGKIDINISVNLEILIHNPNHASFKHYPGKSLVLYRDKQVGEVELSPGKIPARGSETLKCRLTLEADEFASDMKHLIRDVLGGEMVIDTRSRIPGKVSFFGIKRHAVALSVCHIAFGFPDLKVRRQDCNHKTKL